MRGWSIVLLILGCTLIAARVVYPGWGDQARLVLAGVSALLIVASIALHLTADFKGR